MAESLKHYLEIEFLSGPKDGEVRRLEGGQATVGRAAGLEIPVPWDTMVSREHARLTWSGGDVEIEDLGSSYGTLVNDQKVEGRVAIGASDIVCTGHTEFVCRTDQTQSVEQDEARQASQVDTTS